MGFNAMRDDANHCSLLPVFFHTKKNKILQEGNNRCPGTGFYRLHFRCLSRNSAMALAAFENSDSLHTPCAIIALGSSALFLQGKPSHRHQPLCKYKRGHA
jgi:hypothetical protein